MATTVKKSPSKTANKARKGKTAGRKMTKSRKTTTKGNTKHSTKPKRTPNKEPQEPLPIFLEKKHEAITRLLYHIDDQLLAEVWCWVYGYDLDGDDYGPDLDAVPDDIGEVIDALADEAYVVLGDEVVDGLTQEALLEVLHDLR